MSNDTRECVICGDSFTPDGVEVRCPDCPWDPQPAQLRDDERPDAMGHAERNLAMLKHAVDAGVMDASEYEARREELTG